MSGELGKWRWATDTYELTHDKEAHFAACWGLYYFFVHFWVSELWASIATLLIGTAKEIKDALIPWEEYGFWGGDGFSYWDLIFDVAGLALALVVDLIWPPHIRPPRKNEEEEVDEEKETFELF